MHRISAAKSIGCLPGQALQSRYFHISGTSAERAFNVNLVVGDSLQEIASLGSLDLRAVLWHHGSCRPVPIVADGGLVKDFWVSFVSGHS